MKPSVPIILGSAGLLCFTFVGLDCSLGTTKHSEAVVSGKYYVPPWTEVKTTYDQDGQVHIESLHHPEEWHVTANEIGGKAQDVQTKPKVYNSVTNGQFITISVRKGRWTGAGYLPKVEP